MANIAIITARGGSKRIPKKNIRDFLGKPIIAYSIQTALSSGLFDDVIVSTDDEEITKVAVKYGASVPFLRSSKNADDHAGTADVLTEVLAQLKKSGKEYANVCCIYPTAPFITKETLKQAFQLLISGRYDSVFPICAFSYPIMRSLSINEKNKVVMNWPENLKKRSQDLPDAYHDAGQFYWINVPAFLAEQKLFTDNSGAVVLNELQVQDIDNETDWMLAEMKYKLLYRNPE